MVPVNRSIIRISSRSRLVAATSLPLSASLPGRTFMTSTQHQKPKDHTGTPTPSSKQDSSLSQGHANDPSNLHKKDVQSQSSQGGKGTRQTNSGGPVDAASGEGVKKGQDPKESKGNPEGIGMADQVGSASGSAEQFAKKS